MKNFFDTPIYQSDSSECNDKFLQVFEFEEIDTSKVINAIEQNKLLLISSIPFENSSALFGDLVDHYGLRDSYDIQMQFVVHMLENRQGVDDVAVTVNDRGPFQVIQPHSEGDSTSPLDLFGLHCSENSTSGGENILSLINQNADYSSLRAKEKVIIGKNLSDADIRELRREHLDAKQILENGTSASRTLKETQSGKVVVMNNPVQPEKSTISKQVLYTLWDNITVHDHAFHRYQFELLRYLEILCETGSSDYADYMHVEGDSDWAPADTDSGALEQTSTLFDCHIVHKMKPNDFLIFNNRAWTHAVNNWPPEQLRKLSAMYA